MKALKNYAFFLANILVTNVSTNKCLKWEMLWKKVLDGKCLGCQMSLVAIVLGSKCLRWPLSWVENVLNGNCLGWQMSQVVNVLAGK